MTVSGTKRSVRAEGYHPAWLRATEVLLGLTSILISVFVLANLSSGISTILLLLSLALLLNAGRMVATGGVKRSLRSIESLGLAGGGALTVLIAVAVLFLPGLSVETLLLLLAVGLTLQGLGRILHASGRGHPRWIRGSAVATGVATLILAGIAILVPDLAVLTLAALLSTATLVNGVESVVSGLRPTDRRRLILLKLVLFSVFYGLVLINWIDLYATSAPAYHVWLILTYMAPFGVLVVFQGLKDWQLALSLGLLVSLMNDVGYFFAGDLLFGFHVQLVPWLAGQLGFEGGKLLFNFQGGAFTIPVTSALMGASIYARFLAVVLVLYHWWRFPYGLTSR